MQVVEDVASAMESGGAERSEFDKQLVDIIRFMDGKDANQLRDEWWPDSSDYYDAWDSQGTGHTESASNAGSAGSLHAAQGLMFMSLTQKKRSN